MVGGVVGVAPQEGVVAGRLARRSHQVLVVVLLDHGLGVVRVELLALLPGVELRRVVDGSVVPLVVDERRDLAEDVEVPALLPVLLHRVLLERGQEAAVPHEARDVHGGVDAEAVDAHVDEAVVGADQVVLDVGVLGVEVGQVLVQPAALGVRPLPVADPALVVVLGGEHARGRARPLAVVDGEALGAVVLGGLAPVAAGVARGLGRGPQVAVVGPALGHLLLRRGQLRVVALVLHHGVVLAARLLLAVHPPPLVVAPAVHRGGEQALGAPAGAVVVHHVLEDLDALGVRLVDQVLVGGPRRLQPGVDPVEVPSVVAVEVVV